MITADKIPALRVELAELSPDQALGCLAEELSVAVKQREIRDAAYRKWRGQATRDAFAADPKAAEWKVKAEIEALPGFTFHKTESAEATAAVIGLELLADSIRVRAGLGCRP